MNEGETVAQYRLRSAAAQTGGAGIATGTADHHAPPTAKGGVPMSDRKQLRDTVEEPTAPTVRCPINCPDYDWSKDEYHSASEEPEITRPPKPKIWLMKRQGIHVTS